MVSGSCTEHLAEIGKQAWWQEWQIAALFVYRSTLGVTVGVKRRHWDSVAKER